MTTEPAAGPGEGPQEPGTGRDGVDDARAAGSGRAPVVPVVLLGLLALGAGVFVKANRGRFRRSAEEVDRPTRPKRPRRPNRAARSARSARSAPRSVIRIAAAPRSVVYVVSAPSLGRSHVETSAGPGA